MDGTEVRSDRHVSLQGAHNFRDLGGYRTHDGRTTRWGRLFRSDTLDDLTATLARVAKSAAGRAEERVHNQAEGIDNARAEAALQRAANRLSVAGRMG